MRLGIETVALVATKGVSSAKVPSGRRLYRAYSFSLVRHGHADDFSTQCVQETPTPRRGPSKEMRSLVSTLLLAWVIWLLPYANTRSAVGCGPFLPGNSPTATRIIAYSASNRATYAYDIKPNRAIGYDEPSILLTSERHQSRSAAGGHYGTFTEFLAAEGGIQFGTAGDQFLVNASRATPVDGMLDVAVHGSPLSVDIGANTVNHRVLASLIEGNPEFNRQGIRLLSCDTGSLPNGFAQNLANKLGVSVQAPSDTIWAFPNGRLTIGPTPSANSGSFIQFLPGGGRP